MLGYEKKKNPGCVDSCVKSIGGGVDNQGTPPGPVVSFTNQ